MVTIKLKHVELFLVDGLRDAHLALPDVFAARFLCSSTSSFIQVLVPHFALKPLQVHKHLIKVLTVKLETKSQHRTQHDKVASV